MSQTPFNPNNWESFYHKSATRISTDATLKNLDCGSFLIRPSIRVPGDLVLAVTEPGKVKHYLINRLPNRSFKIGDQIFNSIEEMLVFYMSHYLDRETLKVPVLVSSVGLGHHHQISSPGQVNGQVNGSNGHPNGHHTNINGRHMQSSQSLNGNSHSSSSPNSNRSGGSMQNGLGGGVQVI